MNAIVVSPSLRGWSFPEGGNVVQMLPRSTRCRLRRKSPSLNDVADWLLSCSKKPMLEDIRSHFDVSRATGYRYIAMWRELQEAA